MYQVLYVPLHFDTHSLTQNHAHTRTHITQAFSTHLTHTFSYKRLPNMQHIYILIYTLTSTHIHTHSQICTHTHARPGRRVEAALTEGERKHHVMERNPGKENGREGVVGGEREQTTEVWKRKQRDGQCG